MDLTKIKIWFYKKKKKNHKNKPKNHPIGKVEKNTNRDKILANDTYNQRLIFRLQERLNVDS